MAIITNTIEISITDSEALMKKICFIMMLGCLFLLSCVGAQHIKEPYTTIEKIIEVPGVSKNDIYDQTKIFIAENFRSAKDVIEYENKEGGTVIGNGSIKYPAEAGLAAVALANWRANFTIRVDIKDGKFRCTFSNIKIAWPASYDRTIGARPAGERPIGHEEESVNVRKELLKIPDAIAFHLKHKRTKDNW